MKPKLFASLVLVFSALCLSACVSQMTNKHSELTYNEAKTMLVAGKTTKAEVKKEFGTPDSIVGQNARESWTYNLKTPSSASAYAGTSVASTIASGAASLVPGVGGYAGAAASQAAYGATRGAVEDAKKEAGMDQKKILTIHFKNDVVENFSLSTYK